MKVIFFSVFLVFSVLFSTIKGAQEESVIRLFQAVTLFYGTKESENTFALLSNNTTIRVIGNPFFQKNDIVTVKQYILDKDETERKRLLGFCALQKDTSGRDSGCPESGTTTPVPSKFDLEGYLEHVNFQTLTPGKVNPNF